MRYARAFFVILGLALLAGSVTAQDEDSALETEAKQLETMLIAPCCWRQPIADHQSAIATEMKSQIRQMLKEGEEPQAILDHYVAQYGTRILSIPPQRGFNRMSFLMPVAFVAVGLIVVGSLLQRWRRQTVGATSPTQDEPQAPPAAVLSEEMSRRIQKELDEMD